MGWLWFIGAIVAIVALFNYGGPKLAFSLIGTVTLVTLIWFFCVLSQIRFS